MDKDIVCTACGGNIGEGRMVKCICKKPLVGQPSTPLAQAAPSQDEGMMPTPPCAYSNTACHPGSNTAGCNCVCSPEWRDSEAEKYRRLVEAAVKLLEPKAHIGWYKSSKQCAVFGDNRGIEWTGPMLSGWHDNAVDAWADAASFLPSRWINALPEYQRKYIHDIETQCDHTGTQQSLAYITEQRDALALRVEELQCAGGRSEPAQTKAKPVQPEWMDDNILICDRHSITFTKEQDECFVCTNRAPYEFESAEEWSERVGLTKDGFWIVPSISLSKFSNRYASERQPKRRG